jgi:hypothetical protein
MKEEINLMPKQFIVKRERHLYVLRLGRLLSRIFPLLALLVFAQLIILFTLNGLVSGLGGVGGEQGSEIFNVGAEVSNVNTFLKEFGAVRDDYLSWSPLVQDVLKSIPEGVTILSLEGDEEAGDIIIRGKAGSREKVVAFQKNLEMLSWALRVDSPLQNFALETNNEFTFTVIRNESSG